MRNRNALFSRVILSGFKTTEYRWPGAIPTSFKSTGRMSVPSASIRISWCESIEKCIVARDLRDVSEFSK